MAEVLEPPMASQVHPDLKPSNTIVIDGDFLRDQAAEAFETFFAPLHGVVVAATGRRRRRRRARAARRAA